jgi:uncharacterized protein (DUF362 family)
LIGLVKVAVVKGERGLEPVYRALDLVEYNKIFKGKSKALIKVNFITTKDWKTGATTDPIVVEAIVNRFRAIKVEPMIIESDATGTDADKAFVISGMKELCDRLNIEWRNLRHDNDRVEIKVTSGEALKSIKVPRIVVENPVVSAAKLKTHMQTQVTLGMKNMFGVLPDKFKGKFHLLGMDKVIVDVCVAVKPALIVIDGFVGMEGKGPVNGSPVKMDTIIAGIDPVATDHTAARIMGFDPERIGQIRLAKERGLGDWEGIEIVGDGVEAVRRDFKRN